MYEHIAVGFDGSRGSVKALEEAIRLKKLAPEAKLSVIYVNDETRQNVSHAEPGPAMASSVFSPTVDGTYAQYMPPELGEENYRATQQPDLSGYDYSKRLHSSIQQQLESHHVEGHVLAIEGNPVRTISAFAAEQNIDLLVVGNSGKSGLQKFFVGSVSEKVLKESPCSVLIVK